MDLDYVKVNYLCFTYITYSFKFIIFGTN